MFVRKVANLADGLWKFREEVAMSPLLVSPMARVSSK